MSSSYYNKHYFKERDHLDLHIALSIKLLMEDNKLKRALDVGCGTGRLVSFLNESGFKALGCDSSGEAVSITKHLYNNTSVIRASATKLPFRNSSFDLVTAISLIEHLTFQESQQFISETHRVLRSGGFIFIITPNFSSPMRFLFGKRWFAYSDPTHKTFFTPKTLSLLLQNYGFTNITLRPKTAYNVPTDFYLPGPLKKLPMPLKNIANYIMISSPLSTLRDSFWIMGERK